MDTQTPWLTLLLVMGKSRVNQIPVNQLIKHEEKCMLDEEFLLIAMGNGNLLISRVSEIRVKPKVA